MAYLSVVSTDPRAAIGTIVIIRYFIVPIPHSSGVVCRLTACHKDVLSNKGVRWGLVVALIIVLKPTLGRIGLGNAGKLIIPLLCT